MGSVGCSSRDAPWRSVSLPHQLPMVPLPQGSGPAALVLGTGQMEPMGSSQVNGVLFQCYRAVCFIFWGRQHRIILRSFKFQRGI